MPNAHRCGGERGGGVSSDLAAIRHLEKYDVRPELVWLTTDNCTTDPVCWVYHLIIYAVDV